MNQLILLGLVAICQQATPDVSEAWWPTDVKAVFVRIERHDELSASRLDRLDSEVSFFWRASNSIVLLNLTRRDRLLYAGDVCFGLVSSGQWCSCSTLGTPSRPSPKPLPGATPERVRHHWLGNLALAAFLDQPKTLALPVGNRQGLDRILKVDAPVKYDERGLPVEAFGRSEDGKAWARLTVVYRTPTREELGFEFPWLDADRALPNDSALFNQCVPAAADEHSEPGSVAPSPLQRSKKAKSH